jgi:hypothetical protein
MERLIFTPIKHKKRKYVLSIISSRFYGRTNLNNLNESDDISFIDKYNDLELLIISLYCRKMKKYDIDHFDVVCETCINNTFLKAELRSTSGNCYIYSANRLY